MTGTDGHKQAENLTTSQLASWQGLYADDFHALRMQVSSVNERGRREGDVKQDGIGSCRRFQLALQWAWRHKPDDVYLYHKTGFSSATLTLYAEPPARSGFRRKVRVGWWDTSNWMTEIGFSVPRVLPMIRLRLSKETKLSLGRWLTGVIF